MAFGEERELEPSARLSRGSIAAQHDDTESSCERSPHSPSIRPHRAVVKQSRAAAPAWEAARAGEHRFGQPQYHLREPATACRAKPFAHAAHTRRLEREKLGGRFLLRCCAGSPICRQSLAPATANEPPNPSSTGSVPSRRAVRRSNSPRLRAVIDGRPEYHLPRPPARHRLVEHEWPTDRFRPATSSCGRGGRSARLPPWRRVGRPSGATRRSASLRPHRRSRSPPGRRTRLRRSCSPNRRCSRSTTSPSRTCRRTSRRPTTHHAFPGPTGHFQGFREAGDAVS